MKNQLVTLALIFLIPLSTWAAEKMDMTCMTPFPTTSVQVQDQDGKVIVEFYQHNGTQFMPISDSLITPYDVPSLLEQAKVLTGIPSYLRFEWKRGQCKIEDELVIFCMGTTEEQTYNEQKISAWSFSSSINVAKTFAGKFTSHRVALDLRVNNKDYVLPMRYEEGECFTGYRQIESASLRARSTKGSF
ncbi:MAG: hypothetical protein AAGB31_15145 [Bdellovibrio sp.]